MKEIKWKNGNYMLFESPHKTFNKQVDCISTGNVIGSVQLSGYIRPYSQTECNGFTNPLGHLQNYDLNNLNQLLPSILKDWIREQDRTFIGYTFFYRIGGRKIIIGWVVTDGEHKHIRTDYGYGTWKAHAALDECVKYITEKKA